MSKKSFSTMTEIESAIENFSREMDATDDRGAILMGAAYLEDALGALLRAKLLQNGSVARDLLNGPLQGAAARANLAYGLGLIGPTAYRNLKLIREIRNRVAHGYMRVSFEDSGIAKACLKLQLPEPTLAFDPHKDNRKRFSSATALIVVGLLLQGQNVEHAEELKDKDAHVRFMFCIIETVAERFLGIAPESMREFFKKLSAPSEKTGSRGKSHTKITSQSGESE